MVSSWENIDASIANFSRCQLYFSFFFSPPVKRLLRLVTLHHAQRQFSMRCKSTYTSGESRAEGKEGDSIGRRGAVLHCRPKKEIRIIPSETIIILSSNLVTSCNFPSSLNFGIG